MGLPTGLPGAPEAKSERAVDTNRHCPKCHVEARIVANYLGINAYCDYCKIDWPIASTPMTMSLPMSPERGLHKVTLVEPDWNSAYEDGGGAGSEQVGPRRKL
jgi:hypothetical protein